MRRISTWILSTITIVVLMFGYHTSTSGVTGATSPPAITSGGSGSSTTSGTSGKTSSSSKQTSTNKPSAPTTHKVTGGVAQTMWGPVQVQLTVTGSKVTDVAILQYPSGNSTDQEINSYALPVLIQETLSSQSSQIDMVSGATVTSTGYLQSLQSALDQANL
jgi:uncharacterized protein with FMN-binding domain